jgi:RNA polymerase sigma-70 factor (ECF subfamily)
MPETLIETEQNWLARLRSKDQQKAIADLEITLKRSLSSFDMSYEDKEDIIQTALLKILANLTAFKARSRFTSWAIAIAVNTALTELRKRRWKNISLEEATVMGFEIEAFDKNLNPADLIEREWAVSCIEEIIFEELTARQRIALLADINGMSLREIASRLAISRSAVYKLTFDARQKLIKCLSFRGLNAQDLPSVSTWSKTNPIESLVYAIEKETSWKSQGC